MISEIDTLFERKLQMISEIDTLFGRKLQTISEIDTLFGRKIPKKCTLIRCTSPCPLSMEVLPALKFGRCYLIAISNIFLCKGPVKPTQRVKTAHLFLRLVSNLLHFFHFKLAYVVLHMAVEQCFENHF